MGKRWQHKQAEGRQHVVVSWTGRVRLGLNTGVVVKGGRDWLRKLTQSTPVSSGKGKEVRKR